MRCNLMCVDVEREVIKTVRMKSGPYFRQFPNNERNKNHTSVKLELKSTGRTSNPKQIPHKSRVCHYRKMTVF